MKFCGKCGNQVAEEAAVCPYCGSAMNNSSGNKSNKSVSMPAFVLGLIGGIFALFGGMCVSACYGVGGNDTAPLLLMVGGSLVGIFGACLCLKNAKRGSILQIVAALLIAICVFGITGADFMSLGGMLMLALGGVVGLITTRD